MNTTTAPDDHAAIACTLSAAERDTAERIYAAAAAHYTAAATVGAYEIDVHLHGDVAQINAILDDMTQREAGCCSWLALERSVLPDGSGVGVRLALSTSDPTADELAFAPVALREMLHLLFPTARLTAHA